MSVNVKQSGNLIPIASLTKAITPVGLGDCYSDEERVIGCWRDGKPLYQKCVDFGAFPNVASKSVAHNISDLDRVVDFRLYGKDSNGNHIPINWSVTSYSNTQFQISSYVSSTNIVVETGANRSAFSGYAILQYTKMNDTAGSGIWTPDGAYAEHYSEAEHIVGTWIDGRTIYEKSWSIDNTNTTSWENFNHGISNFDTLISIAGSYKQSAGNMQVYAVPYYESTTGYILIAFRSAATYYRVSSSIGAGKLIFTARYLKTS